jgi:hypothetical protein
MLNRKACSWVIFISMAFHIFVNGFLSFLLLFLRSVCERIGLHGIDLLSLKVVDNLKLQKPYKTLTWLKWQLKNVRLRISKRVSSRGYLAGDQYRKLRSKLPVIRAPDEGTISKSLNVFVWPFSLCTSLCVATSHTQTLWSWLVQYTYALLDDHNTLHWVYL